MKERTIGNFETKEPSRVRMVSLYADWNEFIIIIIEEWHSGANRLPRRLQGRVASLRLSVACLTILSSEQFRLPCSPEQGQRRRWRDRWRQTVAAPRGSNELKTALLVTCRQRRYYLFSEFRYKREMRVCSLPSLFFFSILLLFLLLLLLLFLLL